MKVIVAKDYAEMSVIAADLVAQQIKAKPDCVLGLATGSTPEGMYAELIKKYEAGNLDFAAVRSVNLDEYYPIKPDNDQSYRYFMNTKLFDHVNIDKANTNVPNGLAEDAEAEGARYDKIIADLGGIDLQILGIGQNGHIGFNEPDAELIAGTHLADLTEDTIKVNSRFFASVDEVPKQAFSMGIGSIFCARNIIIMASGANKHAAIAKMLEGKLTTMCPATLLNLHPNVTVICDEAAYNG
ncbi:MAG: glucosamine-6-phosphate deaminase [Clostridia bacterium]|nr:glucosamine-6-phosphate deaminase [Clostridia bacterium]